MHLTDDEIRRLEAACRELPETNVQEDEVHASSSPILLLMSTVLSLNRRWYSHALPARRHFERTIYASMSSRTLEEFREIAEHASAGRSDWSALARTLWGMNEWGKARMLTELVDYSIDWHRANTPDSSEMEALRQWALSTSKEEFVGKIKGLGPRAYEQLLWYIEGEKAIKLDRHVVGFVDEVLNRPTSEEDKLAALRRVAQRLGVSPTALDARIWDHMQGRRTRG